MEPTPRAAEWSAWAGWSSVPRDLLAEGRVRLTVNDLEHIREMADLRLIDWGPLPPHQIPLYTPKQIRHLFRLEHSMGRHPPTSVPDMWRSDRTPDADARFRVHDLLQNIRLPHRLESPAGAPGTPRGWEGAARAWAAGAVLLAVLVLLVRYLERCLFKGLVKAVGYPCDFTPEHVRAYRRRHNVDPNPQLDDSDSFPSDVRDPVSNDFPPPYFDCANGEPGGSKDADKPIDTGESPPPSYATCYFENAKDGGATVHLYVGRDDGAGHSSTDTQDPAVSNVKSDDDEMLEAACEVNTSLEDNVNKNEVTVESVDNTAKLPNLETGQDGRISERDEDSNYVVEIEKSDVVCLERVIAV